MKEKKWIKLRHIIISAIAYPIVWAMTVLKYHVKFERFKEARERKFLILYNHQTAYDQFFIGLTFVRPVYYLATEDIFSMGFLSKLLRFAVAPIPIKKQTSDLNAVKLCIKVANEGGNIAIAPEGQRTYSGVTTYINSAIVTLAKKINLPIAFFKIEGGYGVQPRWSDGIRKGKLTAKVSKIVEPEEFNALSKEELYDLICKELYVNEANSEESYKSKKPAEYLERAVYYCPKCGLSTFISHKDTISCLTCQKTIRYTDKKKLEGVNEPFEYEYVLDWIKAQEKYVNTLDLTKETDSCLYQEAADFYKVIVYKRKELIKKGANVSLYPDKIIVKTGENEEETFSFDEIKAVTVLGKNKLNIYKDKDIFQLKPSKSFNAVKYVNIFHRYKNIRTGKENDEFLGL